jgi:hypothetical protein
MSSTQTEGQRASYNSKLPLRDRAVLSSVFWHVGEPRTRKWTALLHRSVDLNGDPSVTSQPLNTEESFKDAVSFLGIQQSTGNLSSALKSQLDEALQDRCVLLGHSTGLLVIYH